MFSGKTQISNFIIIRPVGAELFHAYRRTGRTKLVVFCVGITEEYNVMVNSQELIGWARLKCDGTRAETRFGLSAKWTSPFKLAGASVQSTSGSRGVRISSSNGSNAGYTMFWGRVQDYWLPTPRAYFPFTSPTVRHRVPSGFNSALPQHIWRYRQGAV